MATSADGITIRPETAADIAQVRGVNERAFGQPIEADLVDRLRRNCPDALSLVASVDGRVVGHILFTPVVIEHTPQAIVGAALAPMAVDPDLQRLGIGTQLVTRGLEILRERGCPFVVVVGHPEYYPRFGFEPASRHGVRCQWDSVSDDAFMVRPFDAARMRNVTGVAKYSVEFDEAGGDR